MIGLFENGVTSITTYHFNELWKKKFMENFVSLALLIHLSN